MLVTKEKLKNLVYQLLQYSSPSENYLQRLAKKDRVGMKITLPTIIPSDLELGRKAFQDGRYGDALFHFSKETEKKPHFAWAWHGKGDAFLGLGDYKKASAAFEQASVLNPTEGLHWGGRANAERGLGHHQRAFDYKTKTLLLNPDYHWMFKAWNH